MNLTIPKVILELDESEAIDIYYAVKRTIEKTIDEHWVIHPTCYPEMESQKLGILKQLARVVPHDSDVCKELEARLCKNLEAREK